MDDAGDGGPLEVRTPTVEDIARIARSLEQHGARYVLIGGFAVITHGLPRTTKDVDLLVDPSPANIELVIEALSVLEDRASLEVRPTDLEEYSVVRIADEVMVDLLASACGVTWEQAEASAETVQIFGQNVRVASLETLIATKQTIRPSDAADVAYLEALVKAQRPKE